MLDFSLSPAEMSEIATLEEAGRARGQSAAGAEVGRVRSNMQTCEANGAKIPAIGLGTWQLNGDVGVKHHRAGAEARLPPSRLRADLRQREGDRRGAARLGREARGCLHHHQGAAHRVGAANLERAVKQSLANLRVSDVNLLLIHWPNPEIPLADTMGAMCKMKKEGFTRHIGISNFTVDADRGGGEAFLRADRHQPDRVASLSRRGEGAGRLREARHRGHGLLPDRARPRGRRRGADAHRQEIRQDRGPGIAALAGPEGRDRHPAHLEGRAPDREHVDLRFRAVGRTTWPRSMRWRNPPAAWSASAGRRSWD